MLLSNALLNLDDVKALPTSASGVLYRVNLQSGEREAVCLQVDPETMAAEVPVEALSGQVRSGCLVSIPGPGPAARLPDRVRRVAAYFHLPLNRLELRLPVADVGRFGIADLFALSGLRDAGVSLAVTEVARDSADLFDRLPLTALILATGTVAGLPRDPACMAAVRAIVATATAHGIGVVAAGIATEAQRASLCGLGCEAGEGELFGGA